MAIARSLVLKPDVIVLDIEASADTFAALYRLQALRRITERAFSHLDAIVVPTAPTVYSPAQVLASPART